MKKHFDDSILYVMVKKTFKIVGDKGKYAIEAASAELEKKTCIKLELRKNEEKYLNFSNTEIVNYLKLGANNNIQTVSFKKLFYGLYCKSKNLLINSYILHLKCYKWLKTF